MRKNSKARFLFSAMLLFTVPGAINIAYANNLDITLAIPQQQREVKGNVSDINGETIIGASVMLKGSTSGTITDMDGNFLLRGVNNGDVIVISYVGYVTQEIKYAGQAVLNVTLKEDTEMLDEVVVVGYGAQKKATLTGAVTQVKGQDVIKDRGVPTITGALQGQIPGLQITRTSGRTNQEQDIRIRGDFSINTIEKGKDANNVNGAMILIDGVESNTTELSAINPNDVESISVLKDASAAIYGARAAGGVILVTTKRGVSGKATVTYSGTVSVTLPGIQVPFTNKTEYVGMILDAFYNDNNAYPGSEMYPGILNDHYNFLGSDWNTSIQNWFIANKEEAEKIRDNDVYYTTLFGNAVRYEDPQYMDRLYGTAVSHSHNVSIRGGNDKSKYALSVGYADNPSVLKPAYDGQKRYNARFNLDTQLGSNLTLQANISFDHLNRAYPTSGIGGGYNFMPIFAVYNSNGQYYQNLENPIAAIKEGGNTDDQSESFRIGGKLTWDLGFITKGLSIYGTANMKFNTSAKRIVTKEYNVYKAGEVVNGEIDPNNTPVASVINNNNSSVDERWGRNSYQTYGGFADYNRSFMNSHNVHVMAGITTELYKYRNLSGMRKGLLFQDSGLEDLNTATNDTRKTVSGGSGHDAMVSFIGRLNYDYQGKYLVEVLGRRDGSSKLNEEGRWGNFYSASAGWRISEEKFMKSIEWLNNLKLRFSYGEAGSLMGIGRYDYVSAITNGTAIFGETAATQTTAYFSGAAVSFTRTWETVRTSDIGLDFSLLDNRLTGVVDLYWRHTPNMFVGITYPAIYGATAPKTNSGDFKSHGWEVELGWRDKIGHTGIEYNVKASLSDNRSKCVDVGDYTVINEGRNAYVKGYPANSLWVYKTDGFFKNWDEVNAYYDKLSPQSKGYIAPTNAHHLRPGSTNKVNLNGNLDADGKNIIDKDDLYYYGDANPHYMFGLTAGLKWKGIDFSAFFQGVLDQNVLRSGYCAAPFVTGDKNQNKNFIGKTWLPTNTDAEYPILSRNWNLNAWNYSNADFMVQNNRYVRLKSLVIGYTLPRTWLSKLGLQNVRVYVSGDDLWEWTAIKDGYDPEFGENGSNTYPFQRMVNFGLDVTF